MKDFKEFNGYNWYHFILEDVNNNVKICNEYDGWELFDGYSWSKLLQNQPQFADKCDEYKGWKSFDGHNWSKLLQNQPQFADKCDEYNGWKLFDGYDWSNLLINQPQFTDKCDEYKGWESFNRYDWSNLLQNQPQFSNKCNKHSGWKLFDGGNWSKLLQNQPQFANKCDEYNGWKLFDKGWHWSQLLQEQPQFVDKCYEYNGFNKFDKNKFDKSNWKELIENKNLNFIFLIYDFKKYKKNIHKKYHYLLDIYDNLFKDIETFKKYTDECITTPEIFKLFIEYGMKNNRVNEIIDFEKVKDFIEGFQELNMLMVRNILDGIIENYKNKKERGNKR